MKGRAEQIDKFLTLFRRVKEGCGDQPSRIDWLAVNKPQFEDLCSELYYSAYGLKLAERRHRALYIQNVAADFRTAWRDYEERYADTVDPIRRIKIDIPLSIESKSDGSLQTSDDKLNDRWEWEDEEGERVSKGLRSALEEQRYLLDDRRFPNDSRTTDDWEMHDGLEGWNELVVAGVDVRGIYRRRMLCPVVLLPSEAGSVAYGKGHYRLLLQNTQESFVLGVFPACVALLRANLEAILKGAYGATGRSLEEKISDVRTKLSDPEKVGQLWRIKNLADDVLHGNKGAKGAYLSDQQQLEIELLKAMGTIRALVEALPVEAIADGA